MKKMKFLCILLTIAALTMFAACSNTKDEADDGEAKAPVEINIATLKGPTGMGMVEVMQDTANENIYNFELAAAPDNIVGGIVSGKIDIAAIPTNLAATLYQKTQGNIEVVAVNTLGVLYILEKGENIETMADLSGKTILTAGQGTTAEYVLNYLLEENGLYIDENVTVTYVSEHSEVAAKAQTGDYDIVMLPEPFVTSLLTADSQFTIALNLTDEWEKTGAGQLVMGCLVVQREFAEKEPEALADFMQAYEKSVQYVNANPAEAAEDMEEQDIIKAAVAAKAIPNCHIVFMTGVEMKENLTAFYNILLQANAQSIGGALPPEDFYLLEYE